jgi:hypothetical protein
VKVKAMTLLSKVLFKFRSDSDNGDKKEVNDDSSANSVEQKLVDYSKAQKVKLLIIIENDI